MFNKGDHVITPTGEHGRLIDLPVQYPGCAYVYLFGGSSNRLYSLSDLRQYQPALAPDEADTLQAEINRLAERLVGRFDMSWDDQRKFTRVELQVLPGEKVYMWHDDMKPDGFFDVALALHRKLIDLRVREEHGLTVTEASNGKG